MLYCIVLLFIEDTSLCFCTGPMGAFVLQKKSLVLIINNKNEISFFFFNFLIVFEKESVKWRGVQGWGRKRQNPKQAASPVWNPM